MTGETAEGKAVFVSDEEIAPTGLSNWPPDTGVVKIWGSNAPPTLPNEGDQYEYDTVFPPSSGFRYELVRMWPESWPTEQLTPERRSAEIDAKLPGLLVGDHATESLDLVIVIEGEAWLELDGGEERLMKTGDIAVQNGTRHTWHNRSDQICTIAAVILGAKRH